MFNTGNSEPWHIGNPGILRTLTHLKPDLYSQPSQKFKMECFAKIVKSYNYFSKELYLILKHFSICPSLNKYLLTCRVTSRYVLYDTYLEPCLLL